MWIVALKGICTFSWEKNWTGIPVPCLTARAKVCVLRRWVAGTSFLFALSFHVRELPSVRSPLPLTLFLPRQGMYLSLGDELSHDQVSLFHVPFVWGSAPQSEWVHGWPAGPVTEWVSLSSPAQLWLIIKLPFSSFSIYLTPGRSVQGMLLGAENS